MLSSKVLCSERKNYIKKSNQRERESKMKFQVRILIAKYKARKRWEDGG